MPLGRYIPLDSEAPSQSATQPMAVDQMLLESVAASGQPALRLYRWAEPTLSLGYFQNYDDRQGHRESLDVPCVRRATGGGAILHDHELTYSITMPSQDSSLGAREDLYRRVHHAIAAALREFGVKATAFGELLQTGNSNQRLTQPFLCFQRRTPEDLIVCGYKIAGSAQRKIRGAILQHGSVLLRASVAAPQLPGVSDLTAVIDRSTFADRFAEALARELSLQWVPQSLTDREQMRTDQICRDKFDSERWLHRR